MTIEASLCRMPQLMAYCCSACSLVSQRTKASGPSSLKSHASFGRADCYTSATCFYRPTRAMLKGMFGTKRSTASTEFDLREGVTVRHHTREWIETLTKDFELLELKEIPVHTMNGNSAEAFQWFGRKA